MYLASSSSHIHPYTSTYTGADNERLLRRRPHRGLPALVQDRHPGGDRGRNPDDPRREQDGGGRGPGARDFAGTLRGGHEVRTSLRLGQRQRKYEMFVQTLQAQRGLGSNFRYTCYPLPPPIPLPPPRPLSTHSCFSFVLLVWWVIREWLDLVKSWDVM